MYLWWSVNEIIMMSERVQQYSELPKRSSSAQPGPGTTCNYYSYLNATVATSPGLTHLWPLPLDPGLHFQLPQGKVIVHEQSVPTHVDVRTFQNHVSGQKVREPAAGLRTEQLVGAHGVDVIFQRRKGAFRRNTPRLNHGTPPVMSSYI